MEYINVLNKLTELREIMTNNAMDTSAYLNAGAEYDKLLFENMSFREYTCIVQNSVHQLTIEDEAKMIVAAAKNEKH